MDVLRSRRCIDAADRALVRLLNQRIKLSIRIGRLKRAHGLPLFDPQRERDILRRARRTNGGPLDARALRAVYRALLGESRRLTRRALKGLR